MFPGDNRPIKSASAMQLLWLCTSPPPLIDKIGKIHLLLVFHFNSFPIQHEFVLTATRNKGEQKKLTFYTTLLSRHWSSLPYKRVTSPMYASQSTFILVVNPFGPHCNQIALTVKVGVGLSPPPMSGSEVDQLQLQRPQIHDEVLILKELMMGWFKFGQSSHL